MIYQNYIFISHVMTIYLENSHCHCYTHHIDEAQPFAPRLYHGLADLDPDALRQGLEPQDALVLELWVIPYVHCIYIYI